MSGHRSFADPPTGDLTLRHATAVQGLPSQHQHQHQHPHQQQHQQRPRSAFLDKADSLLLARSKAATFSRPAPAAAPPPASSRSSHIYVHPPPRRSRPSPAFAPRIPASSPTFVSVSPVIRQVSNHSDASSDSSHLSSHSHSHSDSSLLSPPSSPPSSLPPLLPPRSRLRPQSTVADTSSSRSNPLESFPPPAPPKPAHYSAHNHRRPQLSPPSLPLHKNIDSNVRSTSPPPYSSRFASLARAFSPPLPPLPLKTAAAASSRALPFTNRPSSSSPSSSAKMVSCGRVVCVALPFLLAVLSIVALLVATLAGVADKKLYIFEVNTTGLSVSAADAVSILSGRADLAARSPDVGFHDANVVRADVAFHDSSLLSTSTASAASASATATVSSTTSEKETTTTSSSTNITAADLNLGKLYDIALWNYCVTEQNGTRVCSKPEFNWAEKTLNTSENSFKSLISSTGYNLTIPSDITNAIKAFSTLAKWTQVVFIIAFGALALEIIFGLFTSCSRGISCLTFVIASITVVAVIAAAGMATAMSVIVVAAIKTAAKEYGVTAKVDTGFLVAVWISAAAAIAASFFWMFTVCCCSPESRRDRSGPGSARNLDDKSVPVGSYQPLNDPNQNGGYYNNANAYAPQYGAPRQGGRSDLAYEPYSHSRV